MRRRDVLRAAVGATTASLATGAADAHTPADGAGDDAETTDGAETADGAEPLGRLELPGAKELVARDGMAYVATTDGFATVDVSDPTDPTLLARRDDLLTDRENGPLRHVYDGKLGGDYYAIGGPANHREDALHAAMVFDVSDPADPREVLTRETSFHHHNLDTDGETLYLCGNDGETNPLVCVDVETGEELGRWSVVDEDERWADAWHKLFEFHDVLVVDGVAYCAYWNAGTWLVDVSDPTDPTPLTRLRGLDAGEQPGPNDGGARQRARLTLPGNDHFAAPRRLADGDVDRDRLVLNEEAWSTDPDAPASELGGVELWDVDAAERLSRIQAPPTTDATYRGVWTTAHNFEWVEDRLYTAWYRGGVRVHDVSDPREPRELAHWRDSETTSFWTAQYGDDDHFLASSWGDSTREDPEAGAAVYAFPTPDGSDGSGGSVGAGAGFGPAAGAVGLGAAGLGIEALRRRMARERGDE